MADWRDQLPIIRQAHEAMDASELAAAKEGLTRSSGGQMDALRHAYWASKLSQDYGRIPAFLATSAHEIPPALSMLISKLRGEPASKRQRDYDETVMDLKNNRYGIDNPGLTIEALRRAPLEVIPPKR